MKSKNISVTSSLRVKNGQLVCDVDSRTDDGNWLKGQTYVLATVREDEEIGSGRFINATQGPLPEIARFLVYRDSRLDFHGQTVVDWIAERASGPWSIFVHHEGRQIVVEFQFALATDAIACKFVHG